MIAIRTLIALGVLAISVYSASFAIKFPEGWEVFSKASPPDFEDDQGFKKMWKVFGFAKPNKEQFHDGSHTSGNTYSSSDNKPSDNGGDRSHKGEDSSDDNQPVRGHHSAGAHFGEAKFGGGQMFDRSPFKGFPSFPSFGGGLGGGLKFSGGDKHSTFDKQQSDNTQSASDKKDQTSFHRTPDHAPENFKKIIDQIANGGNGGFLGVGAVQGKKLRRPNYGFGDNGDPR